MTPLPAEILSLKEILQVASTVGASGLVILLWWLSDRRYQELILRHQSDTAAILLRHQEETQALLVQYQDHMTQQARMYENNVELVKSWERLCDSQESTIATAVAGVARMEVKIDTNRFCPIVRDKWEMRGDKEPR